MELGQLGPRGAPASQRVQMGLDQKTGHEHAGPQATGEARYVPWDSWKQSQGLVKVNTNVMAELDH